MSAGVLTVAQELAEVSRLVDDDDVETAMARYVARVVSTVPGCTHATITVRADGEGEVVGGDLPDPLGADRRQPLTMIGPVGETLRYREPRHLADARTDQRWVSYSRLIRAVGLRSCLALPLPSLRGPATAFTMYSDATDRFDVGSYDLVLLFTLHAGVAFDNAQLYHDCSTLVGHLGTALATRSSIAQAQGMLMRTYSCDAEHALTLLTRMSQNRNVKLRAIARTLLDAHRDADLDARLQELLGEP